MLLDKHHFDLCISSLAPKKCQGLFTNKNSKKKSLFYGLGFFFAESLSGLILIPLMYRYLPEDSVTSWIFFLGFWPIAPLIISGYGQLVTREIASSHKCHGERVKRIIKLSRNITSVAQIALLILLATITLVVLDGQENKNTLFVWLYFCAAMIARVEFLRLSSILNGFGWIGTDKLIMAVASCCFLGLSIVLIVLGSGLEAVASTYAVTQITAAVGIYFSAKIILRNAQSVDDDLSVHATNPQLLKFNEICKMYIMALAGFLTMNIDIFVARYFLNTKEFIEFGFLSRIMLAVIAVVGMYVQLGFPKLSQLARNQNSKEFLQAAKVQATKATCFSILLTILITSTYNPLISTVLGHQRVLSHWTVLYFSVFVVLAAYIMSVGQAIIALGDNKLVFISVPMSLLAFALACIGSSELGARGLTGGLALTLIASSFLHWKIFTRQSKKLNGNYV